MLLILTIASLFCSSACDAFSEEEAKILTEIAICIFTKFDQKNWGWTSSNINFDQISNNIPAGLSGQTAQTGKREQDFFEQANRVADAVDDIVLASGTVPDKAKVNSLLELLLFFHDANAGGITLKTGRYISQQQIREWERTLRLAPLVCNKETDQIHREWHGEQWEAYYGLEMVRNHVEREKLAAEIAREVELKASSTAASTASKSEILKRVKMTQLKQKLGIGTGIALGVSAVVNVQLLVSGEFLQYATVVVKDTAIAAACSGTAIGLEEAGLDQVAPGAGVVVLGVIDAFIAARTGDWSRFGLNAALNTGATVGCMGGAWLGAQAGSVVGGPGLGTVVGTVIGGIVGGISTRFGLAQTPLGGMTSIEEHAEIVKLAAHIDPQLGPFLKLDTSKSWKELNNLLKEQKVPVKVSGELLAADTVVLDDIVDLIGTDLVDRLAKLGTTFGAKSGALVDGLKKLKTYLGCD